MKAIVFTQYGPPDGLDLKALRYFGEGRHKGKIVIAMESWCPLLAEDRRDSDDLAGCFYAQRRNRMST
jgi:hypothetical protein